MSRTPKNLGAGLVGLLLIVVIGCKGPIGPQGSQGPTGGTGAQGSQGPAGPQGETGSTGSQGPPGPAGADGTDGAQGPPGPQGSQGPGINTYYENFNDGSLTGWSVGPSSNSAVLVNVAPGDYLLQLRVTNVGFLSEISRTNFSQKNVTIRASVAAGTLVSFSTGAYLMLRRSAGNAYAFRVVANGTIQLLKLVNGSWTLLYGGVGPAFSTYPLLLTFTVAGDVLYGTIQRTDGQGDVWIQATAIGSPVNTPGTVSLAVEGNFDENIIVDDIVVSVHDVTLWKPIAPFEKLQPPVAFHTR